MTVYKPGMTADCTDDGLWLDFRENTWLLMIRDSGWVKEELKRAAHSEITITFVQKGIVDAFLLEIYDCLETSDAPFCIKDAAEELGASLKQKGAYSWEVVLIDGSNKVLQVRDGSFSAANSALLREKLNAHLQEGYTSEDFDRAYDKLASRYEPFELEAFTVFAEKGKGR